MKTLSVGLVLCLNIGVSPPDVIKAHPCAKKECWIGVFRHIFMHICMCTSTHTHTYIYIYIHIVFLYKKKCVWPMKLIFRCPS